MNGEHGWDPESLGRLTLAQFQCLCSKEPPDAPQTLASAEDLQKAIAEFEAEEREWHAR